MHIFTAEGIVLNKLKYLETDLIVTIFSKTEGKIKGIVKGGLNSRKRFPGAFEAGNTGEFGFAEKNQHHLTYVNHARIDDYLIDLKKDYDKIVMLSYILGVTDAMLPERHAHQHLFDVLVYTLRRVETGMPLHKIRLFYELHLLKETGLLHAMEKCEHCGRSLAAADVHLAVRTGKLLCGACTDPRTPSYTIPPSLIEIIRETDSHTCDAAPFETVDVSSFMFTFTTGIMKAYIDKPLKLWDMITTI